MAHKVHPKIFRIRGINDWETRGFYKEPALLLEEDFQIRKFLMEKIGKFGVEKIEIERSPGRINIIVFSARPGLIIGRGGEGVEILKKEIEKILNKIKKVCSKKVGVAPEKRDIPAKRFAPKSAGGAKREIRIEIREIVNPWTSANLTGQWIAQQIEKRVPYRRVLKQAISKVMANREIKGVRVEVSGRLNGTEIARKEWLKEGQLPRQYIRADIDYAKVQAFCTYGVIGVKVWIYKGERFE